MKFTKQQENPSCKKHLQQLQRCGMALLDIENDYVSLSTNDKEDVKERKGLPKPWNLRLLLSRKWKKKGCVKIAVVLESVMAPDLSSANKGGHVLGAPKSRELVDNVLSEAARQARALGAEDKWAFAFVNFNHLPWFSLDKRRQRMAKQHAEDRIGRIIGTLDPDRIVVMGDNAAAAMSGDKEIRRKRGRAHRFGSTPMFNGIDLDMRMFRSGKSEDQDMDVRDVTRLNLLGYAARNMAHGLLGRNPYDLSHIEPKARLAASRKDLDRMFAELDGAPHFALDIETTSLSPFTDILTIQTATSEKKAWVVPVTHSDGTLDADDLEYAKKRFRKLFGRKRRWWRPGDQFVIGQNIEFEIKVLSHWLGLDYWYMPVWDTQAGEYMLDENIKALETYGTPAYNLAQMAASYGLDFYDNKDFSKDDRTRLSVVPLDKEALAYCAMDVQCLMGIRRMQMARACAIEHGKGNYAEEYERVMLLHMCSMVRACSVMQHRGMMLDQGRLTLLASHDSPLEKEKQKLVDEFENTPEAKKAERTLQQKNRLPSRSLDGDGTSETLFDIGKREHKELLYLKTMKLEPLRRSGKTGQPSFDAKFLKHYEDRKPVECIGRIKELETTVNNFVVPWMKQMEGSEGDGRMRASYSYTATITGRLSSSKPNFQQVPNHATYASYIKRLLVSPPMCLAWEGDFSAHEVRCWQILSGDENLRKLFLNAHDVAVSHRRKQTKKSLERMKLEGDVHRQNYAMFNDMDVKDVTASQRQDSKGLTFGTMYGMSDQSLGVEIGKPAKQAAELQRRFFDRNKKAERWLLKSEKQAAERYYVSTPLGRRRNMPGYMFPDGNLRRALGRRTRNSPIQGMASDLCMIAADLFCRRMAECMEKLRKNGLAEKGKGDGLPVGVNCMVHDSMKGESHLDFFFLALHVVEWAMMEGMPDFVAKQYGFEMKVPFGIDLEIGSSWADKRKWNWTDADLDDSVRQALKNHKEIHGKHKKAGTLDVDKTLASMKRKRDKQIECLGLERR